MKKKEWHYNKDYKNDSSFTEFLILLLIVAIVVCLMLLFSGNSFKKYNYDIEEYVIEYGDTVDSIAKEYHETWFVGTGINFSEYRDKVYEINDHIKDINNVKPGDIVKFPINPTRK